MNIFRRMARWFFELQIRRYEVTRFISGTDLAEIVSQHQKHLEFALVRDMAERMYRDGLVEIDEKKDARSGGIIMSAKIRVI